MGLELLMLKTGMTMKNLELKDILSKTIKVCVMAGIGLAMGNMSLLVLSTIMLFKFGHLMNVNSVYKYTCVLLKNYENRLKSRGTDDPLPLGYNFCVCPFSPNRLGFGNAFAFTNLNLLSSITNFSAFESAPCVLPVPFLGLIV